MDHDLVVRQKMTEKYLLNELDPEIKDEFEDHFFDCPNCALDIRAGALFVEQSKFVLAENPETLPVRVPVAAPAPSGSGWFAWFRPAFAVPALAALLAVVGYQNLVTYPHLQAALNQPQVLSWTPINVGTMGAGDQVLKALPGQSFLLFARIPPEDGYSHYTAELYNPAGKLEWSLTIPAKSGQDQWPIRVPAANRPPGSYKLVVHGSTLSGDIKEIGQASFELRIQQ